MKRKSNIKRSMAIALAIFVLLQQLGAKTTVMAEETSTVSGGDMQTVTVSDGDAQTETESGGDSQTVSGDGSPTVSGGDVPTVSDGDNVVKKDTGAPVIDSVKYSIGSDALQELEEEETAFITGSGNLHLQVAVSDPETGLPDEEASGVQRVWIKARSQIHEMTYDQTEQVWKAEIAVSEGNYTVLKPSVFAQDKAGNEFQKKLPHFCIDKQNPTLQLTLKAGQKVVDGWYSEAISGEALTLCIDATDQNGIQTVEVSKDQDFQTILQSFSYTEEKTDSVSVQTEAGVISGEQNQTYYVRVIDEWGNVSSDSVQVMVDNTAPKEEVTVKFCGTKDMLVELKGAEEGTCEYVISQKEGLVYDKDRINLELMMADEAGISQASGIAAVDFVIEAKDGISGSITRNQIHIGQENIYMTEAGKTGASCLIGTSDTDIFEKSFRICNLFLTDNAGNVCPGNIEGEKAGMQDQVIYHVDNRAPRVLYTYGTDSILAGSMEETPNGNVQYFNQPFTSCIEISDANLTKAEVMNAMVEGNVQAVINRVAGIEDEPLKIVEKYQYTLEEDGKYQFSTKADDLLHNGMVEEQFPENLSDTIVVDTVAPIINVSVCDSTGMTVNDYADRYFSQNMTVQVQIEDRYLNTEAVQVIIRGTNALGEENTVILESSSGNMEGEIYTTQYQITEEGSYQVQVICADKAGNGNELTTEKLYIDKTAPAVDIVFDKNEPQNKFYYNTARTATVTVTDYSFDPEKTEFLIKSVYDNQPVIGEWKHENTEKCDGSIHTAQCRYSATVCFEKDDVYDFTFACTDKAGLQSAPIKEEHFVIDQTAPVIQIYFDNNEVSHEYFYNKVRTATIQIDDISFDDNLVKVEKSDNPDADTLPVLTDFSDSGRIHTASLHFDKDGVYQFGANAEDLAGNKAEVVTCPLFILDMTAPVVIISGVEDFSANNQAVIPKVEYLDKYLYDTDTLLEITGYYHGTMNRGFTKEAVDDGYSVNFEDFPYTQDMDDLYTLCATISDYAGNETKEEIVFSVNRFGSVYVLGEGTKEALADYYLAQPVEIVITEINVDTLQSRQITGSRDGETVTLAEGSDYTVQKQGTEVTWKSYSYILPADNFEKEGHYAVTVSSRDKADNSSDNRSKGTEVNFAIDKTAPSIVVSDLEDKGIYNTEELTVRADIQDNMGVEQVVVYEDGQVLLECGMEELEENYGVLSFTLAEKEEPRNIRIVALDVAGNQQEQKYKEIRVTTAISKIAENMTPMAAVPVAQTDSLPAAQWLWLLIPAVLVILAGVSALYVVKKRKLK